MKPIDDSTGQKGGARSSSHNEEPDFIPTPLESIPGDIPLPFAIYIKILDKLILFRPAGDTLTTQRKSSLQEKVGTVFISNSSWTKYLETLDHPEDKESEDTTESSITRLRHALLAYHQYLEKRRTLHKEHIDKFRQLGHQLATGIKQNPSLGSKLLRRYNDPLLYFVNHNVNVGIYSAAVAHKLNLSLTQVKMLTFATLLHNVGNLFVPPKVLYKPGPLSKEEWGMVHRHPRLGAELLDRLKLPSEVILTALQHHERIDGEGYPEKVRGQEIHFFAKICTIADVYDALTNRAPYQSGLVPAAAVEKMLHMAGKFDSQILNMLGS